MYCCRMAAPSTAVTDRTEDDQVVAAITQLRSGNATDRETAKSALLKKGSDAVPALIAALEELSREPKAHFDLGNEVEGAEALRRYEDVPVTERNPQDALSIDITWRLERDIVELLGRLHDTAAVPIMIELTRQELHTSQNEHLHHPMQALVDIGEPAVPQILAEIGTVRSRVAHSCCPDDAEVKRRAIIQSQAEIMIARLSIVLGDIRDVRSLPVLEELIATKEGRESYFHEYVKAAIKKIGTKAE